MIAGIIAGVTWALETLALGLGLNMVPFIDSEQAVILAPFVATFIHDTFSALWATLYNILRKQERQVWQAFRTRNGKFVVFAAVIGGPVGMTGYVLTINNLGSSIGAVASAIFPAIGAVFAYLILKEKMQWYRWLFLILTLVGVYGLSSSTEITIHNLALGLLGTVVCSFGWGLEAVILAKAMQNESVKDEYVLQIRQSTSAVFYGCIILPSIGGWKVVPQLFTNVVTFQTLLILLLAGFFATVSYLFYYKAIAQIGASKAMALNVTYAAWAVVFTVIIFRDTSVLNFMTIMCTVIVLICGILSAADYKDLL
ncbi:DMT family transporter [Ligilactobacillus equi]|uniref:DMT superfamily drug/metabolite transporter n=1 Tax=Ligilactobacillus equi DPC 6820 TaxID=1392007 RepID=V7HVQ1_9LACO|nr:DMT family transporter [Ligilactobacillus equi]ETA74319.1 DMT superfamily drug/metabolite transporter [Ligilactobacillus equi DPC 6820]